MKELLIVIYSVGFGVSLLGGFIASSYSPSFYNYIAPCDKPLSKIEYVVPGFQVGCWLGTPWSEDEKKD